jgi:hypothetical protein
VDKPVHCNSVDRGTKGFLGGVEVAAPGTSLWNTYLTV